ncbi:MAG: helix-turn-helix transcriptional regulator [Erysipelotrichaceae bacterium]|nr:helix-turn-helix transcriptional regulator [Erysipelotrichaceae bacterium]
MKLIPGKYIKNDKNGNLIGPGDDFILPLWDYIEMNLHNLNISEKDLVELFDITPSALSNWKNGSKQISQDKLVILASMFGVTIDEFLEREINDDYQYEYFYGLNSYSNKKQYKYFTKHDLDWLFEKINEAEVYIEYYPLGYIPLTKDPDDPIDFPDKSYIGSDEIKYYCQSLDINIRYSTKEKENIEIKSITFEKLLNVVKELRASWKEEAYKHIFAKADDKYKDLVLLSENNEFLTKYINDNPECKNEYLSIWQRLKENDSSYDKNNIMAKVLLANDAMVLVDGEESSTETVKLYKQIIKNDINNSKENK